jgi:hypothetical protein
MAAGLVATGSLKELFKELLLEARNRQRLGLTEYTEFYLVNLLSDFAAVGRLFTQEEEGRKDHEPLAVLYHRALQAGREEQIKTLRRLGDVSLYKAGFFRESLRQTVVGADYYIQMGEGAYGHLTQLAAASSFATVYQELHEKFRGVVDLLEEIAARGMVAGGASGALKVYETWTRTGSDGLEQVLVDAGMVAPKTKLPN